MSSLMDSGKFRRTPIAIAWLAEVERDKTLYCWSCGKSGYAKKDCPFKQRQANTVNNAKQKPVVPANNSTNEVGKHYRSSRSIPTVGRTITRWKIASLSIQKTHFFQTKKVWEAKFGALYCAPLHKECPQHHGHKGDPIVTPGTCDAVGERAQVILVWVKAPGIGNATHPRRLGDTRVRPQATCSLWCGDSRMLKNTSIGGVS